MTTIQAEIERMVSDAIEMSIVSPEESSFFRERLHDIASLAQSKAQSELKKEIIKEAERMISIYSRNAVDSKDTKHLDQAIGGAKAMGDILSILKE